VICFNPEVGNVHKCLACQTCIQYSATFTFQIGLVWITVLEGKDVQSKELIFLRIYVILHTVFTHAPVAQLVEQLPFKEMVVGSIPTGRTKNFNDN
jgi:hypothetical protein